MEKHKKIKLGLISATPEAVDDAIEAGKGMYRTIRRYKLFFDISEQSTNVNKDE